MDRKEELCSDLLRFQGEPSSLGPGPQPRAGKPITFLQASILPDIWLNSTPMTCTVAVAACPPSFLSTISCGCLHADVYQSINKISREVFPLSNTIPTSHASRSTMLWGRYHGGRRPSSDDSFHSPTIIPPSALYKFSIMKRYHRQWTWSHTSPRRSPTMVTLHDTGFVECRWWKDGWTLKTVVTWRSSVSVIPALGLLKQCRSFSFRSKWHHILGKAINALRSIAR